MSVDRRQEPSLSKFQRIDMARRQAGRTTRMVDEAKRLAAHGEYVAIVVEDREDVVRVEAMVGSYYATRTPLDAEHRMRRGLAAGLVSVFSSRGLPTQLRPGRGPAKVIHGAPDYSVVLYDHRALAHEFGDILEEYFRYDPE